MKYLILVVQILSFPLILLYPYAIYLTITTLRSVRRAADLYYRLHTRVPSRTTRPASKSPAAEALEQLAGKSR